MYEGDEMGTISFWLLFVLIYGEEFWRGDRERNLLILMENRCLGPARRHPYNLGRKNEEFRRKIRVPEEIVREK